MMKKRHSVLQVAISVNCHLLEKQGVTSTGQTSTVEGATSDQQQKHGISQIIYQK